MMLMPPYRNEELLYRMIGGIVEWRQGGAEMDSGAVLCSTSCLSSDPPARSQTTMSTQHDNR